jgi:hypothetical protein
MWIFGGTVAAVIGLAAGGWLKLTDSLPVLTAVVGVIGTVLGFYFGGHEQGIMNTPGSDTPSK